MLFQKINIYVIIAVSALFEKDKAMNEGRYKIDFSDFNLIINGSNPYIYPSEKYSGVINKCNLTHTHASYEIFFVIDGALNITCYNRALECRNSIVIIPPNYPHFTYTESNKSNIISMSFQLKESTQSQNTALFDIVSKRLDGDLTEIPITEILSVYLNELSRIEGDSFLEKRRSENLISLIFYDIFTMLMPSQNSNFNEKYYSYINQIEGYIADHYNEKVKLSDIAKTLYLSTRQVSRIIYKEFCCTFSEKLNTHRLNVARMLLVHSSLEINKIASTVGYEYPANFYNHFKKAYGVTPLEYRSQNQNG